MPQKKIIALLYAMIIAIAGFSNNIQVTNVSLTSQNTTSHVVQVQFTLSWENSWRIGGGPGNWDAAWVFVKYRLGSGQWFHAYLNSDAGHVAPPGSTINTGLLTPGTAFNASTNPGVGAYIYRSAVGNGTFTVTNAQLQWNYAANGLSDNAVVDVQVYAIEQVYITQGIFAVGDGLSDASQFALTTINTGNATTTSSGSGSLGGQAGGYPTGLTAPPSASWPNGYNALYCMKYEISQQGYVDFLNSLTRTQQALRVGTSIPSGTTSVTNRYVMSNSSVSGSRNGIRCDATIDATAPVIFYCDLDGDGIGGESNDGKDLACNYFNWWDAGAYLDWAGLRPMTEMEYEKFARGPVPPFAGEFAWGNSTITGATSIINPGLSTEAPNSGSNAVFGNAGSVQGPLRVGSIAGAGTNRQQAGAGYYGNMELSGNLFEFIVTMTPQGYIYLGTHGNGLIDAAGNFTNTDWPQGVAPSGIGLRGGSFFSAASSLRISDRLNVLATVSSRLSTGGGRGVRTAP